MPLYQSLIPLKNPLLQNCILVNLFSKWVSFSVPAVYSHSNICNLSLRMTTTIHSKFFYGTAVWKGATKATFPCRHRCHHQTVSLCSTHSQVYTKTGDRGTSALYTGERRSKDDPFFKALGSVDELSSFIGLAKEFALEKKHDYVEQLERIQCILQDIGTIIATPLPRELASSDREGDKERLERLEKRMSFSERHTTELEGWIDHYTELLPPLNNFILPGGGRVSASLHVCRTMCRKAERAIVPLTSKDLVDGNVLIYMNRLSDYLFTVARHATVLDGKKETIYIRPKPHKEPKKEKKDEQEALTV